MAPCHGAPESPVIRFTEGRADREMAMPRGGRSRLPGELRPRRGDGRRGAGPGFGRQPLDPDRRQRLEPLPAVRLRAPRLPLRPGAVAPSAPASSASPAPDGLPAMKCHRSSERGRVGGRGQPGSDTPRRQPWSPPRTRGSWPDDSTGTAAATRISRADVGSRQRPVGRLVICRRNDNCPLPAVERASSGGMDLREAALLPRGGS